MSLKASISGIRGIIGLSLTPQVIIDYCCAFSELIGPGPVLIGSDSRPTRHMVGNLVSGIITALGHDIIDIGIIPTPVVLFGVTNGDFAGGIVITASHNPIEWNALKLVNGEGKFLSPAQFSRLQKIYQQIIASADRSGLFDLAGYETVGIHSTDKKIAKHHHRAIIDYIDTDAVCNRGLSCVVDTVNGAGGPHTIGFLEEIGCQAIPIHTEPTGIFAHHPEPTPAHLADLSQAVVEHGSNVGFALDPDGDRLVLADETGRVLSEELTLALCVKHYLETRQATDVVINMSTSRVIEDICNQFNVQCLRVPTGEIHVTEKLLEQGAAIGGEGNGGVILTALNTCRDALVGIALICEMLTMSNKPLSQLADELPRYFLVKTKTDLDSIDYQSARQKLTLEFPAEKVDTSDGIRIDFTNSWVLLRLSNTEPIVRIFAEAGDEETANALINRITGLLSK